ncbi:hypothetical protein PF005_g23233 [Phytophthora fragariae]|uniref:Uncharacterized protein n=1 Tax=Phytophthora fragariae TaxID=53985 RepID=A0A6A3HXR4_9STRA|nr:hypothetical protein PF003_g14092 [Phytophthora fragariae]KAE8973852.1 hypothetical protein PF011_g25092 [Phytophthora fragariae]KAE9179464.1 hypothetical protein PF004_g25153 [Phytophthora fragariae]KAE9180546.1 hypothetical protein PF005_g23233 [Phytophthora fragariae]
MVAHSTVQLVAAGNIGLSLTTMHPTADAPSCRRVSVSSPVTALMRWSVCLLVVISMTQFILYAAGEIAS